MAVPTWNFDPSAITFVEKMAKRTAPGPFAAAPIVQGKFDGSGVSDALSYGRGSQISDLFYAHLDPYQGTIVMWVTPEKNNDEAQLNDETIYFFSSDDYSNYQHNNVEFLLLSGGSDTGKTYTTVAGFTTCLVMRWDVRKKFDIWSYLCFSLNDSHSFGGLAQPVATAPSVVNYIGSAIATLSANSIIEGFTVYRRVLYDGTYGVDAGNGDEIALIYAGGSGKKPEEITGADDICFQLPTDGSTGELVTGTGEAWSFPWADNELANWHMQDDDDTEGDPDDWTIINGAVCDDAATDDILYGTRSQKISVDAALEGIRGDTTPAAGEDKVVWAWVKTGGANQGVDLRIYDNDGSANIVEMTTDASAWTLFNTCYEVPAGCTDVQHFIESTDADTYTMHVGQVQVLPNLWDDGGFETGTAITGVGSPTTSEQSSDQAQSGSYSWKIVSSATDEGFKRTITTISGKYYLVTGHVYADTAGTVDMIGQGVTVTSSGNDAWKYLSFVMLANAASEDVTFQSNAAQTFYVDDVSVVALDDVSITVTPASEANSAESSGIRVDGLDSCTATDFSGTMSATSGKVRFDWTPRHGDNDFEKFGSANPRIMRIQINTSNFIEIYSPGNVSITLRMNVLNAGAESTTWDATGVTAGTTYLVEIEYNATQCTLSIDGSVEATITYTGGIDFGASIPDTAYIGTDHLGVAQYDAVFATPPLLVDIDGLNVGGWVRGVRIYP